jgi:hypothetical protein
MFGSDRQRRAAFYNMNKFSMGGFSDVGSEYGDIDYDFSHKSHSGLIQPKSYDVEAIPRGALKAAGVTKEEAQDLFDKHGIRIGVRSNMSRDVPLIRIGDRIIGLGDEDHYEFYPGVVKEVSEDKALIVFDETKNEVWYPINRLLSQDMINKIVLDKQDAVRPAA